MLGYLLVGLPREQRPAGPARRAGPEPLRRRPRGHPPVDDPRHDRRRAGRRPRHRRRDRVGRDPRAVRPGHRRERRPGRASRWPGCSSVGLAIGIAAHRLPGAERDRDLGRALPAGPRGGRPAARRAGASRAGRGRSSRRSLLSAIAWGATILAFAAAGQSVDVQLTIGQAALLASGVALASAIPAGPANLGHVRAGGRGDRQGDRHELVPRRSRSGSSPTSSILVVTSIGGVAALAWLNLPRAGR